MMKQMKICPYNAVRKSEDANSIGNEPDEKMQTWQSAYLEILYHLPENLAPQYEPDGTNSRSSYYYNPLDIQIYLGLHDFDDDGILELIVGDLEGMAVFTVCDNVLLIVEMLTGGIIGVIPNVAGILFGEKDYVGIRVLCKKMLKYSYILLAVIFVLIMLFTEEITVMFGSGGGELGSHMVQALRIFALCVAPYLWNKFIISYYESIEETAIASFATFLENAVVVLPATLVGILVWKQIDGIGIDGIAAGFVATEIITAVAACIFRKIRHKNTSFYIVPDKNPGINLDFSIKSTMEEAQTVHKRIIEFCQEQGASKSKANLATVCAEEMTVNIIRFGGKTSNWIDINLCLEDELCRLRIRDNGVNFNPLEYNQDSEEFDIHGIELVKKISRSMDYIRAIDMNNTIISF